MAAPTLNNIMQPLYIKDKYDRWELNEPAFQQLVAQIAAGMQWQFSEKKDNCWYKISNSDKALSIRMETRPSTIEKSNPKVKISGDWSYGNDSLWSHIPYNNQNSARTEISCSVSRGVDAIVKDIQKRLLPYYIALYDKALIRKQEYDAEKQLLKDKTQFLADIFKAYPHTNYQQGNVININPKIKPELGEKLGLDLKKSDSISVKAGIYLGSTYSVDHVDFELRLPYELGTELMQWLADKTIDCYETWHKKMIHSVIHYLDGIAKKAGLPEVTELPPNNYNWKEAYTKYCTSHFGEQSICFEFKDSIITIEQPPNETLTEKAKRLQSIGKYRELVHLVSLIEGENLYGNGNKSLIKEDHRRLQQVLESDTNYCQELLDKGLCGSLDFDYALHCDRRDFIKFLLEETKQFIEDEEKPMKVNEIATRADPDQASSKSPQEDNKMTTETITIEYILALATQLSLSEQAELASLIMDNVANSLEGEEEQEEQE